ncbi:hypothetical protein MKEN_00752300 [Mycena kentingensis (nom. inval.)]|nr:hypothetical protein MKEN_00752300 [Mycena kentingensis (nom. inval.)]
MGRAMIRRSCSFFFPTTTPAPASIVQQQGRTPVNSMYTQWPASGYVYGYGSGASGWGSVVDQAGSNAFEPPRPPSMPSTPVWPSESTPGRGESHFWNGAQTIPTHTPSMYPGYPSVPALTPGAYPQQPQWPVSSLVPPTHPQHTNYARQYANLDRQMVPSYGQPPSYSIPGEIQYDAGAQYVGPSRATGDIPGPGAASEYFEMNRSAASGSMGSGYSQFSVEAPPNGYNSGREYAYDATSSNGRSSPLSVSTPLDSFSDSWEWSSERPTTPAADELVDGLSDANESPLKFVDRRDAPGTMPSSENAPAPAPIVNNVDATAVQNLFDDCTWRRSDTTWLDAGVWSEFITFPDGLQLTSWKKIYRMERVHGMPSEIPFLGVDTVFLISATDGKTENEATTDEPTENMTIDNIFRDGCPHSFGNSPTGSRGKPDTKISGIFFPGCNARMTIAVRRARAECTGILACDSLDPAFIEIRQGPLDPDAKKMVLRARLRDRELQNNTRVGQVMTFTNSLEHVYCRGILADGTRCSGHGVVLELAKPKNGKKHGIACSARHGELQAGSAHVALPLPPYIDEGILANAIAGKQIIDEEDNDGKCAMTLSRRSNKKNGHCPMNHWKDGRQFKAKLRVINCGAKMTLFCPDEQQYPDLALTCLVFPHRDRPHLHVTALGTRCPHSVRERYKTVVREYGAGATVARVENSEVAQTILGSKPTLFHPGLASTSLKTRLLREVRLEAGVRGPRSEDEEIASYVTRQQSSASPYIHSWFSRGGKRVIFGANAQLLKRVHDFRTLDFDSSYKPVNGKFQMFELNGFLAAFNRTITGMRVWIEPHDRLAFGDLWTELLRLIRVLTSQNLRFKGLHRGGKILGINSDMEAAPLLGFADAVWGTLSDERKAAIGERVKLLSYVLRICHVHFDRGVYGRELAHLPASTLEKLAELKTVESVAAFEEWEAAVRAFNDKQLDAWLVQKKMHRWLIPGIAQPLSNIPLDDWHLMPPNTNVGEGQHRWNNIQTGVSMGVIDSMEKYEKLDAEVEAELVLAETTGDNRNEYNDAVHRCASSSSRQAGARDKARRARVADDYVRQKTLLLNDAKEVLRAAREQSTGSAARKRAVEDAKRQVAEAEAALALAKAEVDSNSSGRVPLPRPRTRAADAASCDSEPLAAAPIAVPQAPPTSPGEELAAAPTEQAQGTRRGTRKRVRSTAQAQAAPAKAKRVKKAPPPLDLEWPCWSPKGKHRITALESARMDPEGFKSEWQDYAELVDEMLEQDPLRI